MRQRGATAAPCREPVRRHLQDRVEVLAREPAIRPCPLHHRIQLVVAVLATGGLRDDLLGQHVERRVVLDDRVELAAPDAAEQRRAFHQIVPRDREQPPFRQAGDGVAGAADALQQRRDAMRRSDLTDQIDVADVDAELERGRRDQRLQPAGLQTRLGVQPLFLRQAAVMRGNGFLAKPIAEVPGQPFGHPPRIDEDQRRAVRLDQRGETLVVLLPDLV